MSRVARFDDGDDASHGTLRGFGRKGMIWWCEGMVLSTTVVPTVVVRVAVVLDAAIVVIELVLGIVTVEAVAGKRCRFEWSCRDLWWFGSIMKCVCVCVEAPQVVEACVADV